MKSLLFSVIALLLALNVPLLAEDGGPLPFGVKVAGQSATHKKGEAFAKLDAPVANDAELQVDVKAELIIVNVAKVNAKDEPDPASPPAVLLMQGTTKTSLDKTMDGKKLGPGSYLLSISAAERTATIKFAIK